MLYEGNGGGQRVGNFIPFTDSHTVDNSCVFDAGDGLTRTPGTASNLKKWTFSTWIKPGDDTRAVHIIAGDWNGSYTGIRIQNSGRLMFEDYQASPATWHGRIDTVRLFDQYDAWVHIFFRYDSTPGTPDGDDIYFAINGVQVTNFYDDGGGHPTYPAQNRDTNMNSAVLTAIGGAGGTNVPSGDYFDGYMAETIMVDGYALSPSVFGQTDTSTNRWIPKEVTVATLDAAGGGSSGFGDEGFYLEYGAAGDLGDDTSGEINDWTELNLTSNNQSVDTPTKNYITFNPLQKDSNITLENGNTIADDPTTTNWNTVATTMTIPLTGKYYFEMTAIDIGVDFGIGVCGASDVTVTSYFGGDATCMGFFSNGNLKYVNGSGGAYGNATSYTYAAGTGIGVAVDRDNDAIWFSVINSGTQEWIDGDGTDSSATVLAEIEAGTTTSAMSTGLADDILPVMSPSYTNGRGSIEAPTSSWNGDSIPTGFVALNQDNMAANTAGITGLSWIKNRDATAASDTNHMLQDRVRGIYKYLISNDTDIEATDTNSVQRFLQQGVQIGNMDEVNTSAESFVLWQWANDGSETAIGAGSISTGVPRTASTVRVNTTAGFSIITYTGDATNTTVGHGLTNAPEFIFGFNRASISNRHVGHQDMTSWAYYLNLDENVAEASYGPIWNSTAPTSSVISLGTEGGLNGSGTAQIMYAFHSVEGYSKFGTYEGNGDADGPFIYTGFRPSYLVVKNIDATGNWWCVDAIRSTYNEMDDVLFLDSNAKEEEYAGVDFTANGFKLRSASTSLNGSNTFIYAAFAENPFGGSGVAQAKAR
jgi:hypothetical protein